MSINFEDTSNAYVASTALGVATTLATTAFSIEKKVAHFSDPTAGTRMRCVKWAKPWPGAKICVGHAYDAMERMFFVRVSGPDPSEAAMQVLNEALLAAAAAAVSAGVASVGLAALPAAKAAFVGYLTTRGAERLLAEYSISLDHLTCSPESPRFSVSSVQGLVLS